MTDHGQIVLLLHRMAWLSAQLFSIQRDGRDLAQLRPYSDELRGIQRALGFAEDLRRRKGEPA